MPSVWGRDGDGSVAKSSSCDGALGLTTQDRFQFYLTQKMWLTVDSTGQFLDNILSILPLECLGDLQVQLGRQPVLGGFKSQASASALVPAVGGSGGVRSLSPLRMQLPRRKEVWCHAVICGFATV
eukprot:869838-Amphidinium_carterae.2